MLPVPYPVRSVRFWRAYWIHFRPYLAFVSASAGLVGLSLSPKATPRAFYGAFSLFFLMYGFGQALTDVFQTDTDKISSPYRPLGQGIITKRQVLMVSLTGLLCCTAAFTVWYPPNLSLFTLGIAGLGTYTYFKRRWWGGPFWNSWVVALLPVVGYLSVAKQTRPPGPALWLSMGSVLFTYAVFVLLGYFKDISADRATGYHTFPVVFGWRPAILVSFACAIIGLSLSLCLLIASPTTSHPFAELIGAAMWLLGAIVLLLAHRAMWTVPKQQESLAYPSICHSVRGFVLIHLGESVVWRPSLWIVAMVVCLAFEWALARREERTQV